MTMPTMRCTLAATLVLATGAWAQDAPTAAEPGRLNPIRVPGVVKHAGTYHLATGTWTRATGTVAHFGSLDVVYCNTADSGYYAHTIGPTGPLPNGMVIDEGGLPGLTNPTSFVGVVDRESYRIQSFDIGYCDMDPGPRTAGFEYAFYESYSACTPATTPNASFTLTGLPSAGSCWTMTIDITGSEFDMLADGGAANPGYDGDPDLDAFGWSVMYAGTGSADAGLLLRGDPLSTDPNYSVGDRYGTDGTETYYGALSLCGPGVGSGYLSEDIGFHDDLGIPGGLSTGCYFFGGYRNNNGCGGPLATPYASMYMQLSAEAGHGGPCPGGGICGPPFCANQLPNSTGVPGVLTATGSHVAADNNVVLRASSLPPGEFGLFVTGLAEAVAPIMVGNGLMCIDPTANGGLGRFDAPGQVKSASAAGVVTLDTNIGEWDLGAINTSTGTYAASAGVTTYFQFWHRDQVGAGFNLTAGLGLTWQ